MHTVTSANGLVFLMNIVQLATADGICKAGTYGQLTENLVLTGKTVCQPGIPGTYAKNTLIHDGVSTYSQIGAGATRHIFRIRIGTNQHMWLLGWYMGQDRSINFRNPASTTSVPVHNWVEMCNDGLYTNSISFVLNSLFDCKDCGMHSHSAEGSTVSTDCFCNAGFSGPNGQTCTQCTEGKYKTSTGSGECNDCGPGKYMSQTGTVYCKDCAVGKYKSFSDSTFCEDCATGKYNPGTGKANCEDCNAGKYNTVPGSVDCQECAIGKFRSNLKNANCQDCVAGKYNIDTANANCQTCASGKYNSVPGSDSCQDCPVNSFPTASSAFCLCNAGFSGTNDGSCTACADGQYKSDIGNANCEYCPAHSNSAARSTTSTACSCNIGFSGLNSQSEYENTHIISLATFERIATILRVASSESINVTSTRVTISVQRDKATPSQPTPASSSMSTISIVLAVLFVYVFASIFFICHICNLDANYRNMHLRQVRHLYRHENVAHLMY